MWQYQTLMSWCNLKEVGWGWTSTMKIMDLKITVDSSGEDELVRNPSSSSVLMQQLSSVKTGGFWGWSGGGRYGKHLRGWDLGRSKDVGEILLTVAKGSPKCSKLFRCNMLEPTVLLWSPYCWWTKILHLAGMYNRTTPVNTGRYLSYHLSVSRIAWTINNIIDDSIGGVPKRWMEWPDARIVEVLDISRSDRTPKQKPSADHLSKHQNIRRITELLSSPEFSP